MIFRELKKVFIAHFSINLSVNTSPKFYLSSIVLINNEIYYWLNCYWCTKRFGTLLRTGPTVFFLFSLATIRSAKHDWSDFGVVSRKQAIILIIIVYVFRLVSTIFRQISSKTGETRFQSMATIMSILMMDVLPDSRPMSQKVPARSEPTVVCQFSFSWRHRKGGIYSWMWYLNHLCSRRYRT